MPASVVMACGRRSLDFLAPEHRLGSGGGWPELLRGMWGLPGSGKSGSCSLNFASGLIIAYA